MAESSTSTRRSSCVGYSPDFSHVIVTETSPALGELTQSIAGGPESQTPRANPTITIDEALNVVAMRGTVAGLLCYYIDLWAWRHQPSLMVAVCLLATGSRALGAPP